jgi:hypothetical protein
MSIKKTFEDSEKTVLEFDNGDKMKLKEIMDSWHFKDEESFLRFAMIVFSESSDKKTIAYYDNTQSLIKAQPVDNLIKKN